MLSGKKDPRTRTIYQHRVALHGTQPKCTPVRGEMSEIAQAAWNNCKLSWSKTFSNKSITRYLLTSSVNNCCYKIFSPQKGLCMASHLTTENQLITSVFCTLSPMLCERSPKFVASIPRSRLLYFRIVLPSSFSLILWRLKHRSCNSMISLDKESNETQTGSAQWHFGSENYSTRWMHELVDSLRVKLQICPPKTADTEASLFCRKLLRAKSDQFFFPANLECLPVPPERISPSFLFESPWIRLQQMIAISENEIRYVQVHRSTPSHRTVARLHREAKQKSSFLGIRWTRALISLQAARQHAHEFLLCVLWSNMHSIWLTGEQ